MKACTTLARNHAAYPLMLQGKPYTGRAVLFGNAYMTHYEPVKDAAGQVVGILFIGFDIRDFQASLDKLVADAKFRGADAEGKLHFPGFHIEAAQLLLGTGAGSIGVDTLSLDHGPSPDFAVHYAWLPANRFGIECMANLDALPASGATLVVGAPKHRGGSGGPARLIALV